MNPDHVQKDCFAFTLIAIVLALLAVLLAGCGGKAFNKPFGSDYAGMPPMPPSYTPRGTTQEAFASSVAAPPRPLQTNILSMSYPPGFVATRLEQSHDLVVWQGVGYRVIGEDWEVIGDGPMTFYRVVGQ